MAEKPLIHCITNPISITQCANAVLALNCRPMMAEHPKEVRQITNSADALLLNLGNITSARIRSIKRSAKTAHKRALPFVLDAVGVACLKLRKRLADFVIKNYTPSIIKGNYSEILALYSKNYTSTGVDAQGGLEQNTVIAAAKALAEKYNTVVLASGKEDIVTDGEKTVLIKNGCDQLSFITGTGCMLGAICACMLSYTEPFKAAVNASALLGICGERAKAMGNGSFLVELQNELSAYELKTEDIKIEEL